jgi:Fic-DOC domain mobile mystery protein B
MDFDEGDGATPLDPDEAADLIPSHITTKGELNTWEAANIVRAENWLFRRRKTDLLTDSFVRSLHRRMFDSTWRWAGQYRRSDKNIGVHWPGITTAVREALENVEYWLANGTFDLDMIAAGLHHRMVAVHPFPNGNGRLTRLFADALLFANNAPRFTWGGKAIQTGGTRVRADYLKALRSADAGDLELLVRFARS